MALIRTSNRGSLWLHLPSNVAVRFRKDNAGAPFLIAMPGAFRRVYWVGGTGNWSDPAHWSNESGGAGGATPPINAIAVFDANSFGGTGQVSTVDAPFEIIGIETEGVTNEPTIRVAANLIALGEVVLDEDVTLEVRADVDLANVIINSGTFIARPNVRLSVGSTWQANPSATLVMSGSTILLGKPGIDGTYLFAGGGHTYYHMTVLSPSAIIMGSSRFNGTLIFRPGQTITFEAGTTNKVYGWIATGGLGALLTLQSTSPGNAFTIERIAGGGALVGDYISVSDCTITGNIPAYAGANGIDGAGNTGWTFDDPPAFDGTISGTVTSGGMPVYAARIRLIKQPTSEYVGERFSDEAGAYAFLGLDPNAHYHAIAAWLSDDHAEAEQSLSLPLLVPVTAS